MRVIDLNGDEVRTAAVSPDGRFLAASDVRGWLFVFEWATGEPVRRLPLGTVCDQFAFLPDGRLVYVHNSTLRLDAFELALDITEVGGNFAGGVAVSPDNKMLVAARAGPAKQAKLEQFALPGLKKRVGFEYWSPFRKLAFSPDGVYLAGIWPGIQRWRPEPARFELRYAASGGLDFSWPPATGPAFESVGFVSFSHDSGTCVFGWGGEFRVYDISTGTGREVRTVRVPFRDAAFTGSGRSFVTAEESGLLKLWDPKSWQVMQEYDWGCGPLSCVAFTADGTAGVCGTTDGRLVLFDVDE